LVIDKNDPRILRILQVRFWKAITILLWGRRHLFSSAQISTTEYVTIPQFPSQ